VKNRTLCTAVILLVTAVLLASVFGCTQPAPSEKTVTSTETVTAKPREMRVAFQTVAGTSWHELGVTALPDRIDRATDGRVKLILTSDIVAPKDELDATGDQRVEAAWFVALYFTAVQPAIGVAAVPGMFDDEAQYVQITEDTGFAEQLSDWTLSEYNARTLVPGFTLRQIMYSNRLLDSVDDFAGFKMRVANVEQGELMTALGASPTSVAWTELYMGLQTGVVDGAITGLDSGYFASFYEVVDHVADWPPFRILNPRYFVVNEDFWQSLPDDVRSDVKNELQAISDEQVSGLKAEYDRVVELFRQEGVTVSIIDDASEMDEARPAATEVGNAWLERAKEANWQWTPEMTDYLTERGYTLP